MINNIGNQKWQLVWLS